MQVKRRGFLGTLAVLFATPILPIPNSPTRIFDGGIHPVGIKPSSVHLYCTNEMIDDIRNWGVDQIDEMTRKEIYACGDIEHETSVHMV